MAEGILSDYLDEDVETDSGEEESGTLDEGDAESLDEEAMMERKLNYIDRLSDTMGKLRLDELLPESSTSEAGAEGSGMSKSISAENGGKC
ncbi:hypothetical protein scyTo_0025772 [Scyliorhinus torazame]|uniref:Uncharacterized protein n=1 Tax=Scyliorhinus torazame TaxID=75743 RepID=A0A401QI22_SCYTO|nr:hypothetical protein [Scyliorhinus torazame]